MTIKSIALLGSILVLFAALVGPRQGQAQGTPTNRLTNPGFEDGLNGWSACGGAGIVDAQAVGSIPRMVHSGRYALRMGNPTTESCPPLPPEYSYLSRAQTLYQTLTIPPDAPGVTVSFWYSIIGTASSDVTVVLAGEVYDPSYDSAKSTVPGRLYYGDLPGWQLFRQVLTAEQLARVKAQGTLKLQFRIDDPLTADEPIAYYLDDIQVAPTEVRTPASPLPAALKGDTTRPLAFVRRDPNDSYSYGVYTMDTDGTNAQSIYPGELHSATGPAWSNDGAQIAIIDRNVYPRSLNQGVSATALVLTKPDGGNPRTIYQTEGIKGDPDFIQQIDGLDWSPDNSTLAANIFAYRRKSSGTIDGCLSRIETVNAANGAHAEIVRFATNPSWGTTNQILFESYTACGQRDNRLSGIWQADPGAQPVAEQRILPGPNSFYDEGDATWAPDGRHFVTNRTVQGPHQALMLFDQQDLANPRLILLGDQGDSVSDPTWSPDGKYLAYTVIKGSTRDVWWLDVATGATGPITTDGLSSNADWRPACTGACTNAGGGSRTIYLPLVRR